MTLVGTVYTHHYTRCRRRRRTSSSDTRGGRYTVDCSLQRLRNLWLILSCHAFFVTFALLSSRRSTRSCTRLVVSWATRAYPTIPTPLSLPTTAPRHRPPSRLPTEQSILIERAVEGLLAFPMQTCICTFAGFNSEFSEDCNPMSACNFHRMCGIPSYTVHIQRRPHRYPRLQCSRF
jgi:hypothetical protein